MYFLIYYKLKSCLIFTHFELLTQNYRLKLGDGIILLEKIDYVNNARRNEVGDEFHCNEHF